MYLTGFAKTCQQAQDVTDLRIKKTTWKVLKCVLYKYATYFIIIILVNLQTTIPSNETLIQVIAVKCSLIQNKNTDPTR